MHDLVRYERGGDGAMRARAARLAGRPGAAVRWALALAGDGRRLALVVAPLLVAALGVIKAFDRAPWSTLLTPLLLAAPYAFALGLGAVATGARRRALPALRLVASDLPRLGQIAGMACAGCGGKIIVESEGALCEQCDRPCHGPCTVGHRGEHRRREVAHPYR
jgi:hypothetical protein